MWSHAAISWVQQNNETSSWIDEYQHCHRTKCKKTQKKMCEGRVKPQIFHFLWRYLDMPFLRDAKVALPMVQSPIPALDNALKTCLIPEGKEESEARGRQPILPGAIPPQCPIPLTCQQTDPEDQTITSKHFMTIFKCKYFLLSLHLAQICTNNLEVTSYYILLSNPSDSAFFLFTLTVHWCSHSPLKMPV